MLAKQLKLTLCVVASFTISPYSVLLLEVGHVPFRCPVIVNADPLEPGVGTTNAFRLIPETVFRNTPPRTSAKMPLPPVLICVQLESVGGVDATGFHGIRPPDPPPPLPLPPKLA